VEERQRLQERALCQGGSWGGLSGRFLAVAGACAGYNGYNGYNRGVTFSQVVWLIGL